MNDRIPEPGWIPFRVDWRGDRPEVEWVYLGTRRFTEPFFEQTVSAEIHRHPFPLLFRRRSSLEFLFDSYLEANDVLPPAGFIFHMSRCGSTLFSRMLGALPENVVISEAPSIDSIVREGFYSEPGDPRIVLALRGMIAAIGRRRNPEERRLYVKFDAWSILGFRHIKNAFPDVPWIFLYRDPVEVIVSQLRRHATEFMPGVVDPRILGLELEDLVALSPDELIARSLGCICREAIECLKSGRGIALNYRKLPDAIWSTIVDHFELSLNDPEIVAMKSISHRDAKNPRARFQSDTEEKRQAATEAIQDLAECHVGPSYRDLEMMSKIFDDG